MLEGRRPSGQGGLWLQSVARRDVVQGGADQGGAGGCENPDGEAGVTDGEAEAPGDVTDRDVQREGCGRPSVTSERHPGQARNAGLAGGAVSVRATKVGANRAFPARANGQGEVCSERGCDLANRGHVRATHQAPRFSVPEPELPELPEPEPEPEATRSSCTAKALALAVQSLPGTADAGVLSARDCSTAWINDDRSTTRKPFRLSV